MTATRDRDRMAYRLKGLCGQRVIVRCDDGETIEGRLVANALNGPLDPKRPHDHVTARIEVHPLLGPLPVALGRIVSVRSCPSG